MDDSKYPDEKPLILIADDDQFIRTAFQDALAGDEFATEVAHDGPSAISSFKALRPDLVLLDLIMPGKDGCTICRELRNLPEGKYTPVLMVTGNDDATSIQCAFEAGATDFVTKPIKPELLAQRVRHMLRASQNLKKLAVSEERLATAQRIAHLGNWELSSSNGMIRGSEEMFRILGIPPESRLISFERFLFAVSSPDRHRVASSLADAYQNRSTCSIEFRVQSSDSPLRIVCLQGQTDPAVPGQPGRMVGTLQDITEMRQVEDTISLLKEAVDCLPIGITLRDLTGKILYVNPAEAELHGYTPEELIGREIRHHTPQEPMTPCLSEHLNQGSKLRLERIHTRKNGLEFPVQFTSIAVKNGDGRCLGFVTTCEDISGRKEAERKIHNLAYFDPLTGLPNREMLYDRLRQAVAHAQREDHKVCLVFLDLDNFKEVNDTYGHDFGDKLLRAVAVRLSGFMRESDTLARLAGDEFVVLLTSVTSMESTVSAVQRLSGVFSQPFELDSRTVFSSASIGIAIYPDDGRDEESLFKCADMAMYHSKNEGRARFCFFSKEMNHKIMRRASIENCLRLGLDREEFYLDYQPQWDLKTARMVGVEVLLRWQSADFGLMLPSEFIDLTEDTGLIFDLGQWVLRTACAHARNWSLARRRYFKVAVNISGKQLKQPDFLEMVESVLRESDIERHALEFEFSESVVMEQADKNLDILLSLKRMGIQVCIDNFGTGYSSLNHLKNFPIDRIKIDRSFVADLDRNDDATLVETVLSMGHSLNRKVLALGVENGEQLNLLASFGCDEAQGFYLAMPMSAEEVTSRMRRTHGKRIIELPS